MCHLSSPWCFSPSSWFQLIAINIEIMLFQPSHWALTREKKKKGHYYTTTAETIGLVCARDISAWYGHNTFLSVETGVSVDTGFTSGAAETWQWVQSSDRGEGHALSPSLHRCLVPTMRGNVSPELITPHRLSPVQYWWTGPLPVSLPIQICSCFPTPAVSFAPCKPLLFPLSERNTGKSKRIAHTITHIRLLSKCWTASLSIAYIGFECSRWTK